MHLSFTFFIGFQLPSTDFFPMVTAVLEISYFLLFSVMFNFKTETKLYLKTKLERRHHNTPSPKKPQPFKFLPNSKRDADFCGLLVVSKVTVACLWSSCLEIVPDMEVDLQEFIRWCST